MKILFYVTIFTAFIFDTSIAQQKKMITKPDGQQLSAKQVDNIVKQLMDTAEVTGLCLGIINDNKIAYVKTYGYKNKEKYQLIDTSTCFYAASLAKPVFAYIVMQLVDKKIIDLDKPLYTYLPKPLPEYENYKDLAGDERYKLITARNCLSHTTGFPNWRWANPKGTEKLEIFFTPGKRYAYSGEGLQLLQMVIETITGKGLEEIAQQNIFRPFRMTRTSFVWQPSFETDYALGYDLNGNALEKHKRTKAGAAGSMETTITDYSRFVQAVMQGQALSKTSKQKMLSTQIDIYTRHQFPSLNNDTVNDNKAIQLSYGLGWGLFNSKYGKVFFKEGHDDGWVHYTIHFPGKKYSLIIMTNSSNGESIFKELVEKLTGVTIPWQWESYTPYRATVKLTQDVLQQFTGVYDGKLNATISLVNNQLMVESEAVGLAKSNVYAQDEHHFFLKVMDVEMEFKKGVDGKIDKVIVDDEGEHYELKKVN